MTETDEKETKSRSQIKREFQALKNLAKQLVGLSETQLQRLGLTEELHEAVLAAQRMTRAALQRQYKYVAGLIAHDDAVAIQAAIAVELRPRAAEVAALHDAERWRDELIAGDDSLLQRFVEQHPGCDRQELCQLLRNAKRERKAGKSPRSVRMLFQYLKRLGPGRRD